MIKTGHQLFFFIFVFIWPVLSFKELKEMYWRPESNHWSRSEWISFTNDWYGRQSFFSYFFFYSDPQWMFKELDPRKKKRKESRERFSGRIQSLYKTKIGARETATRSFTVKFLIFLFPSRHIQESMAAGEEKKNGMRRKEWISIHSCDLAFQGTYVSQKCA